MKQLEELVIGFNYAWNTWNKIYDISRTASRERYSDEEIVDAFEVLEKSAMDDFYQRLGKSKDEITFTKSLIAGTQTGYYAAVFWNKLRTTKEEKQQFPRYQKFKSDKNSQEQNEYLEKERENGFVEFLDKSRFDKVLNGQKYLIVDFYGIPCPPCKILAPIYGGVAEQYHKDAFFANLNAWESPEISKRYNIRGVPTILFFEEGKPKDRLIGLVQKSDLIKFVEKNIK